MSYQPPPPPGYRPPQPPGYPPHYPPPGQWPPPRPPQRHTNRIVIAVIVGVVGIVAVAGVALVAVFVFATSADRDSAGDIVDKGSLSAFDLRVGDCVDGLKEGDEVTTVTATPCTRPHDGQVLERFVFDDGPYPGDSTVTPRVEEQCKELLAPHLNAAADAERYDIFYFHPTKDSWTLKKDREALCLVVTADHSKLTTPFGK